MNIFKTWGGKAFLFFLTVVFTLIMIAGIGGFFLCYDYGIYDENYVPGSSNVLEEHSIEWMQAKAESIINRAKVDALAQRAYTDDEYAFLLLYDGKEISYGAPWHYEREPGEEAYYWGYDTSASFNYGKYDITIWARENHNEFWLESKAVEIGEKFKAYWHYLAVGGAIMTLICFVGLMSVSGRKNRHEEPVPGFLNVLPFDLEICIAAGLISLVIACCVTVCENGRHLPIDIILFTLAATTVLVTGFFYGLCMEFAARIKLKNVFSHTIIGWVFRLIFKGIRAISRAVCRFVANLPGIWPAVLITALISFGELFGLLAIWDVGDILVLWFLEKAILIPALIYLYICMHRLHTGTKALAAGDLSYKTDTRYMLFRFKEHGDNLNSISEGMSRAVNESIKSERMKTELITNVSHDIKTPLTSIINYSDLISREKCDNEKIGEYAEVISRQSAKLKRLLEDLLELSKASTGNVAINLERCDAGILLGQAVGEYEEKLQSAGIIPVTDTPEESICINADRRLLWRVFDNLMSNIAKYALTGSRAFFTLSKEGNKAVFRFKNTSRDMLNISPEELKARFVRGDVSRNTEGNGLGLSIAENLVSAQGGKLDIYINADLFMATIVFDCLEDTDTQSERE
ncbi:MAG: HAMP domain-containing histidine kinase [Lachnospiraceae bacterium]|nr:HAMP domain-containing histidine kinase [Lachnospiraceae bacterium]